MAAKLSSYLAVYSWQFKMHIKKKQQTARQTSYNPKQNLPMVVSSFMYCDSRSSSAFWSRAGTGAVLDPDPGPVPDPSPPGPEPGAAAAAEEGRERWAGVWLDGRSTEAGAGGRQAGWK